MTDAPENPDSVQQACRMFKAADTGVPRANAFLLYLEGEGESPLPGFLKERGNKAGADKAVTPAIVTGAATK